MAYISLVLLAGGYYYMSKSFNEKSKELIKESMDVGSTKQYISYELRKRGLQKIFGFYIGKEKKSKILNKITEMKKIANEETETETELIFNKNYECCAFILNKKNYIDISLRLVVREYVDKYYPKEEFSMAILYHELGHIKYKDNYLYRLMLANGVIGLFGFIYINRILMGVNYFILNIIGNIFLKRREEKICDLYAAKKGEGENLIKYFEKSIEKNQRYKKENKFVHWHITKYGNKLSDIGHPLLTTRIKYLKEYMKNNK